MKNFLFDRILIYLEYFFKADTKFNIHPPYLFDFINFVFDANRIFYDFNLLHQASENIKANNQIIPKDTFSESHHQVGLTVGQFYKKAGHPLSKYECLYRMALFLKSKNIIDFGACVGMSSLSFALASKHGRIISIEGNKFLSASSIELYNRLQVNNIDSIHSEFNNFLESSTLRDVDLVFLDGDHQYNSTLHYFSKIIHLTNDSAVIVLDDIHWSPGMYKAWKKLINHPMIQCSLETTRWGFLFKNKALTKGAYAFISQKFKPWKIGIF